MRPIKHRLYKFQGTVPPQLHGWIEIRARPEWISLWIVGQAPRLPREHAFQRQAGRLPYKQKRGLPNRAAL